MSKSRKTSETWSAYRRSMVFVLNGCASPSCREVRIAGVCRASNSHPRGQGFGAVRRSENHSTAALPIARAHRVTPHNPPNVTA